MAFYSTYNFPLPSTNAVAYELTSTMDTVPPSPPTAGLPVLQGREEGPWLEERDPRLPYGLLLVHNWYFQGVLLRGEGREGYVSAQWVGAVAGGPDVDRLGVTG